MSLLRSACSNIFPLFSGEVSNELLKNLTPVLWSRFFLIMSTKALLLIYREEKLMCPCTTANLRDTHMC